MALEFSRSTTLSTDKIYFFLEDNGLETDGYKYILDIFSGKDVEVYDLGFDGDRRYPLVPSKLLTFNETETEE